MCLGRPTVVRVTSSRLEHPTNTTGAHRARRRAPRSGPRSGHRSVAQRPPARYEPYLDGLFTYCLSVLCDHDAATAVLGEALAVAERQHGRCPADPSLRKAWLYALARWACLRELARRRRARHSGAPSRSPAPPDAPHAPWPAPAPLSAPLAPRPSESAGPRVLPHAPLPAEESERRRAELARLAWPEAAGTTPEQREALELAVRHQMGAAEVGAVLGMAPQAARELLSAAACEVERTRAALAVVETGTCPAVARLTGDHRVLLSAALRRELVRHVDDCPQCRRSAERAEAAGPWPGSTVTPATLPLVPAPRQAVRAAMLHAPRTRGAGPRFGRDGFPLDPKDQAARRDRMRARAVTTTVVATVVAAPVLALWAAYRGDAELGEGRGDPAFSATDEAAGRSVSGHYANAGSAHADPRFRTPRQAPDVSVEVIGGSAPSPALSGRTGPGRVTVAARPYGDATMLTLTASGEGPVDWSLWTDAPWLYATRTSGTLEPGRSVTVYVSVDRAREPLGPWSARIHVSPSGAVVSLTGYGTGERPGAPDRPKPPSRPTAPPSGPPVTDPGPAPTGPPATSEPPPATEPPPSSAPPTPTDTPPPASEPPASEPPASDPQPQ
ncbi:hypothetical protein SUDANB99_03450 [Streptomyces sp. enrichment culture]